MDSDSTISDEYTISEELIGSGGMAEVHAAKHMTTGAKVAVKVLNRSLCHRAGIRARFQSEIDILTACIDKPNVAQIITSGSYDDRPAFVMERYERSLLDEAKDAPLTAKRALTVMGEILTGLSALHEIGVVHRDLKPSNILVRNGHAYISDMGVSLNPRRRLTVAGSSVGTPSYSDPELAKNPIEAKPEHDLYSLGLLLFGVSTGRKPTVLTQLAPAEIRQATGSLPASLARVILRATNRGSETRYMTVEEMLADVLELTKPKPTTWSTALRAALAK